MSPVINCSPPLSEADVDVEERTKDAAGTPCGIETTVTCQPSQNASSVGSSCNTWVWVDFA